MSQEWKIIKTTLEDGSRSIPRTEAALNELAGNGWDVVELIQEQGYIYIIAKKPAS
jgi:hypothetical protein